MATKIPKLFELLSERGAAKQLSQATGISTGSISDWKSGKSAPTIENLKVLADYFGVSVDYLLDHDRKDAPAFSPKQRKVLELYDSLSPEQQENFERLLDSVLGLKKQ